MGETTRLREEWLDPKKAFPFPDWKEAGKWIDASFPKEEHYRVWSELARDWVERIAARFPVPMDVAESTHFVATTPQAKRNILACLDQVEDYRVQIQQTLAGLPLMEWGSKSVVIIAPDEDWFLRYVADYYDDGEYMMPGGICLRNGFTHFVLPNGDLRYTGRILAHELTHVFLTGNPWPRWLEEAVVQAVEHKLTGQTPYRLDKDTVQRHRRFWTAEHLQAFWTGESFLRRNEGSTLSYHLARFLLEGASQQGHEKLWQFLKKADKKDSGFSAMHETLGLLPDELLRDLLGAKTWKLDGKAGISF